MSENSLLPIAKNLLSSISKRRKQYREGLSVEFSAYFREVFARHPVLEAVRWEQYTPYYNDGESCTFRVYGSEPDVRFVGSSDFESTAEGEMSTAEKERAVEDLCDSFFPLANQEPEAFLEMFGDHARVTATRDGFAIEKYSHS